MLCLLCVTPLVCSSYSSFAPSSPFFSSWWHKDCELFTRTFVLQCSPSTSLRQPQTTHVFSDSGIALLCHALRIYVASRLLPTITVTPSDSNYVNRSAFLKRFSWIIFTINELVDRIRNLVDRIRKTFFMKNLRRRPDIYSNKMRRRPDFVLLIQYVIFFPQIIAHNLFLLIIELVHS